MRAIEFRGKRVDSGEWVYGDLQHNEIGDTWISKLHTFADKCKFWNVIPETVGQFTGYFDKNGDKIFEGMYVTKETQAKYKIIFEGDCFTGEDYFNGYYDIPSLIFAEDLDAIEVVKEEK